MCHEIGVCPIWRRSLHALWFRISQSVRTSNILLLMSDISDPANSPTLLQPGPLTVEDDFRQPLRGYRLPSRPAQAPVLRSASRARAPGTGAEVALEPFKSLQQWVWGMYVVLAYVTVSFLAECVWAATPVYDADTNTTLLEFYLTVRYSPSFRVHALSLYLTHSGSTGTKRLSKPPASR